MFVAESGVDVVSAVPSHGLREAEERQGARDGGGQQQRGREGGGGHRQQVFLPQAA